MALQTVFIGDDFDITFSAIRADGTVLDLTGATLYCDVQPSAGGAKIAAASFALDSPTTGKARARFSSAQSQTLTADTPYLFDGRVVLASGEKHTIGTGSFKARAAVTPTP